MINFPHGSILPENINCMLLDSYVTEKTISMCLILKSSLRRLKRTLLPGHTLTSTGMSWRLSIIFCCYYLSTLKNRPPCLQMSWWVPPRTWRATWFDTTDEHSRTNRRTLWRQTNLKAFVLKCGRGRHKILSFWVNEGLPSQIKHENGNWLKYRFDVFPQQSILQDVAPLTRILVLMSSMGKWSGGEEVYASRNVLAKL